MKQKMELVMWVVVAGLLVAYAALDVRGRPAHANDAAGRMSAVSQGGPNASDNFFLVDTNKRWIGLYVSTNNRGPRLVSAQNYELASAMAALKADSDGQTCEGPNCGWSVNLTNQALEKAMKELATPPGR